MTDRTDQIKFDTLEDGDKFRLWLNPHRSWKVKDKFNFGNKGDENAITHPEKDTAIDVYQEAMTELLNSIASKYKESNWWKQTMRDGMDVTDEKTYGVTGIPGVGRDDVVDSPLVMGFPDQIRVRTFGNKGIEIEEMEYPNDVNLKGNVILDQFKHMTANEVKRCEVTPT